VLFILCSSAVGLCSLWRSRTGAKVAHAVATAHRTATFKDASTSASTSWPAAISDTSWFLAGIEVLFFRQVTTSSECLVSCAKFSTCPVHRRRILLLHKCICKSTRTCSKHRGITEALQLIELIHRADYDTWLAGHGHVVILHQVSVVEERWLVACVLLLDLDVLRRCHDGSGLLRLATKVRLALLLVLALCKLSLGRALLLR